jgi:outer membrane receptor protein involved in Fe transport
MSRSRRPAGGGGFVDADQLRSRLRDANRRSPPAARRDRLLHGLVGYPGSDGGQPYSGLVNAGKASSKGVELSTSFRANDRFTLGFNAAYTDAQLDENFPLISVAAGALHQEITNGVEGDMLPYVPKWSWAGTR